MRRRTGSGSTDPASLMVRPSRPMTGFGSSCPNSSGVFPSVGKCSSTSAWQRSMMSAVRRAPIARSARLA
jgi:hypothetical protein